MYFVEYFASTLLVLCKKVSFILINLDSAMHEHLHNWQVLKWADSNIPVGMLLSCVII